MPKVGHRTGSRRANRPRGRDDDSGAYPIRLWLRPLRGKEIAVTFDEFIDQVERHAYRNALMRSEDFLSRLLAIELRDRRRNVP